MFISSLLALGTALPALAIPSLLLKRAESGQIQIQGGSFCLATMDSTEVHLFACDESAADQKWTWEEAGSDAGRQQYRVRAENGMCLTKETVPCESSCSDISLTPARPGYMSTRLRVELSSCDSASAWSWYDDRLCVREWFCLGIDAAIPANGSGLRFYGNANWTKDGAAAPTEPAVEATQSGSEASVASVEATSASPDVSESADAASEPAAVASESAVESAQPSTADTTAPVEEAAQPPAGSTESSA